MRVVATLLELAGWAAIAATVYLLNPILLLGVAGAAAVAAGNLIDRRSE